MKARCSFKRLGTYCIITTAMHTVVV